MWAALGAIASAAGQIIPSLFGDDEETETTTNYKAMAKAAEKAGFNPLTVLRNGGAAGFTTTHHPALSVASGIGQALGTVGNAMMAFDPRADERADLEMQMRRAELKRIEGQNAMTGPWHPPRSFDVPTAAAATTVGPNGAPVLFEKPTGVGAPRVASTTRWVMDPDTHRMIEVTNVDVTPSLEDIPAADAAAAYDQWKRQLERWERFASRNVDNIESWFGTNTLSVPKQPFGDLPGQAYGGRGNVRPKPPVKRVVAPNLPGGGVAGNSPRHWNLPGLRGW